MNIPEYGWKNSESSDSHSYLLPVVDKEVDRMIKDMGLENSQSNLFDAGCGNGYFAGYFASKGFNVAGCDASSEGISIAKSSYPTVRFESMSVYEDLVMKFGKEWDLILSTEVIEHLYDPRKYINNLLLMLKPGGALIITTPYHGYLKNLALAITGKMDQHHGPLWDGGHIKFWSKKTLEELLQECGFDTVNFSGAGRCTYLWKSMVLTARSQK